jgi:hypothetical protein
MTRSSASTCFLFDLRKSSKMRTTRSSLSEYKTCAHRATHHELLTQTALSLSISCVLSPSPGLVMCNRKRPRPRPRQRQLPSTVVRRTNERTNERVSHRVYMLTSRVPYRVIAARLLLSIACCLSTKNFVIDDHSATRSVRVFFSASHRSFSLRQANE